MAQPTTQRFMDAVITRKWEGREDRISPLGMEFQVVEGENDTIYQYLMEKLQFQSYIDSILNKELEGAELSQYSEKHLKQLKEDIKGSKVKITIKIELEKYE